MIGEALTQTINWVSSQFYGNETWIKQLYELCQKNLKGIKLWKENATALDSFRTLINLYLST